jgi:heterodisulfide reductase subunit C
LTEVSMGIRSRTRTLLEHPSGERAQRSLTVVRPELASQIQRLGAKKLARCYNCGTCTAICPLSKERVEFPRTPIRHAILGLEDKLLSSPSLWLCYYCGECSDTCPRDADPGAFMMAARRYAIRKYSWGKLASVFYGNPVSSAAGLLLATVVALLGVLLLRGPVVFSPVNLQQFFSFEIIHNIGLLLGAFVGLSAVGNLAIMAKQIGAGMRAEISLRKKLGVWFSTLVASLIRESLAQIGYLKCTNRNRYFAHMALFWGFVGMSVATLIDFVLGIGNVPLYPVPPQRVLGVVSGITFCCGAVYYVYKRVKRDEQHVKFSHFTDWAFVLLLFLSGITGLLLTTTLYTNSNLAAYTLYAFHLVVVFDLIVLAPFTKFAHAIYRPLAVWMNETTVSLGKLLLARGEIE